ncbi:hypothetical protein SBV1_1760015 [Verrucomicrobia bacterium]|nr:hypothetical protein SBV1_1760015 [Verrucomicrobiota bacterium]
MRRESGHPGDFLVAMRGLMSAEWERPMKKVVQFGITGQKGWVS